MSSPAAALASQRSSGRADAAEGAGRLASRLTSSRLDSDAEVVEALARLAPLARRLGLVAGRARRTRARARAPPRARRARRARSPGRRGCRSRSPRSGPARTGSPAAFAVHWQRSSLRAPPPTMCISGGAAPVTSLEQARSRARARARGSRARSGRRLRARRARPGPYSAQKSRIRSRHVAGGGEARVVRIDERAQRRGLARQRDELVEADVVALERPGAPALVQEPEAR